MVGLQGFFEFYTEGIDSLNPYVAHLEYINLL